MAKYAENTSVSPEKSLIEIRATLKRYGATKFGYLDDETSIILAFEAQGRRIRFRVPLPDAADFSNHQVSVNQYTSRPMTPEEMRAAREKAIAQRWRALLLVIKAKLESVESGIETFEQAFMAHLVLPSGATVSEWAVPQIEQAYQTGQMPPLMIESGK